MGDSLRRRVLASLVVTAAISPCPAGAQATACPRGPVLPAYAHNDYTNPQPLYDALEVGFRGVEADILLRGGYSDLLDRPSADLGRPPVEIIVVLRPFPRVWERSRPLSDWLVSTTARRSDGRVEGRRPFEAPAGLHGCGR
jgi:hypothetical protein